MLDAIYFCVQVSKTECFLSIFKTQTLILNVAIYKKGGSWNNEGGNVVMVLLFS